MKIIQIVDARPSLQKLAAQDLSIKTLYKVSKLLGKLDEELVFYNEHRSKILGKYCDIVDNQYVPREENVAQLNAELGELLDTDIEYEVKEVTIGINEDVKLSYNDVVALQGFVRIEGEE
jgi:hypothetical protein